MKDFLNGHRMINNGGLVKSNMFFRRIPRGLVFVVVFFGLYLLDVFEEKIFVMVDAAACGSCLASSVMASHHHRQQQQQQQQHWKNNRSILPFGGSPRWIVTTTSSKAPNRWFHPAMIWNQLLSFQQQQLSSSHLLGNQLCQYTILFALSKSPWWSWWENDKQQHYLSSTSFVSHQSQTYGSIGSKRRRNNYPFLLSLSSKVFASVDDQDSVVVPNENQDTQQMDDDKEKEKEESGKENAVSVGMVTTIGIYKNYISPLLPPACRFVPTCSQYGVQAIEEFGPSRGVILTAWRLLRCSPFGGKGYDPPKWPPVAYTYSSW
jgi:putative membrane protein insertion efficiency factor